jgi:hypothetical protein
MLYRDVADRFFLHIQTHGLLWLVVPILEIDFQWMHDCVLVCFTPGFAFEAE